MVHLDSFTKLDAQSAPHVMTHGQLRSGDAIRMRKTVPLRICEHFDLCSPADEDVLVAILSMTRAVLRFTSSHRVRVT